MVRKKNKLAKGFGARYGSTVRKRWADAVASSRAKYLCERCGAVKVRRVAVGIWECGRCGYKFAGQAYITRAEK